MSDSNRDIDVALINAAKRGDTNEVKRLISEGADVNAKAEGHPHPGWTALHHVVFYKQKDILNLLSGEEKVNVNAKDNFGLTPLHLATIGTIDTQIIRDLLYKGADINAVDERKRTPLHFAADNKEREGDTVLSILLDRSFDPDINVEDKDGNTPLSLAIKEGKAEVVLRWAAKYGRVEIVKELLAVEGINVNAADIYKYTALHLAAKYGRVEVVKELSKAEGIDVNASRYGTTPLDEAVAENYHLEVIVILLSNGANSANLVNQYKWTPLHLAVAKGDVQGILNEQANANSVESENNWTPLHLALKKDKVDIDVLNALLGKEGIDVNLADKNGDTPLRLVLGKHNIDINVLNALLGKEGIDVNLADKNGDTPLHLALKKDKVDIDVLNTLLRKEGIDVNLKDKNKDTPLFLVLKKDNIDINVLNALLRKEGIDANLEDKNKDTPLFLVLKKDNIDINVLNALLEAKDINVNLMDSNKDAPLHSFLKWVFFKSNEINIDVLNALLRKEGIDVNARDKYGETPLHWIFRPKETNIDVLNALLRKEGIDVNARDKDGKTPLHFAAQFNREKEVVEVLLTAKKVDINIVDKNGKTPLDLTTNKEIKTLLKKAAEDPDAGSADEPSTDSEGVQEGDAQTEEQPSSFFGSLFSILMKPFSLIGSFFGGFFSWLFGSDTDEPTSQIDASVSPLKSNLLEEKTDESTLDDNSFPALNQSAGQTGELQLGADDIQPLG